MKSLDDKLRQSLTVKPLPVGERPWLSLYPSNIDPDIVPEHANILYHFRKQLAAKPDATAIWYFGAEYSFRDLERQSNALAAWLLMHEIKAGSRVSLLFQNSPDFIVATLAAWKVGAIPTPSNPAYRAAELLNIFRDCAPTVIICEVDCYKEVVAALGNAGQSEAAIIVSSQRRSFEIPQTGHLAVPADAFSLQEIVENTDTRQFKAAAIDREAVGLLLYTSGTTGMPKGAMLKHASIAFNAESLCRWCALDGDARILAIAPLFHVTGFICHMAAAFRSGAVLIMNYRFEPKLVLDVIRRTRPTFTIGAITAFNALMSTPGIETADMASFRSIYSGGAPIPPILIETFKSKLGIPIHTSYGMTETSAPTHLAPLGSSIPVDPVSGALAVGIPIPSTEAMCVDDNNIPLPRGQTGELVLRGPQIMKGYYKNPEETEAALEHGWMHSGDVAFQDEAGWFYLVDRKKDVIIASGFKVWPREVEDVLYLHPAVREAAVVGVPDAYRGETVKAYVSLQADKSIDGESLIAHCRQRLTSYKVPRSVHFLEDLPKTVSGKIQRVVLKNRN